MRCTPPAEAPPATVRIDEAVEDTREAVEEALEDVKKAARNES